MFQGYTKDTLKMNYPYFENTFRMIKKSNRIQRFFNSTSRMFQKDLDEISLTFQGCFAGPQMF